MKIKIGGRAVRGAVMTALVAGGLGLATGTAHADTTLSSTQTGHFWGIYNSYHYDTDPNTKLGPPDGYYPDGVTAHCWISDSDSYVGNVGNVWYQISWVNYSEARWGPGVGSVYVGTAYVFGGYFDNFNAFHNHTLSRC